MLVVYKRAFDAKRRGRSDHPKYGKYGYKYGKYGQKYGKKIIENHIKLSKKQQKSSEKSRYFLHFINGYQSKIKKFILEPYTGMKI